MTFEDVVVAEDLSYTDSGLSMDNTHDRCSGGRKIAGDVLRLM